MPGRPAVVRALKPGDLQIDKLGDMLQVLLGAGDVEFVASIQDSVQARVRWLLEGDDVEHGDAQKRSA